MKTLTSQTAEGGGYWDHQAACKLCRRLQSYRLSGDVTQLGVGFLVMQLLFVSNLSNSAQIEAGLSIYMYYYTECH